MVRKRVYRLSGGGATSLQARVPGGRAAVSEFALAFGENVWQNKKVDGFPNVACECAVGGVRQAGGHGVGRAADPSANDATRRDATGRGRTSLNQAQ